MELELNMDPSPDVQNKDNGRADGITVNTGRFGEITVNPELIIRLTSPFPGFPESTRFIIIPHKEGSVFLWLQSLDNPDLAFVVIQAGHLKPDYSPAVPELIKNELESDSGSPLEILIILTVPPGRPREMTANLMGPVVINSRTRLARQLILDQDQYDPCWPVFRS
ncbi:MAG: flagellar assembly protein FliW [Desulfurivibrionaceae bacterium]